MRRNCFPLCFSSNDVIIKRVRRRVLSPCLSYSTLFLLRISDKGGFVLGSKSSTPLPSHEKWKESKQTNTNEEIIGKDWRRKLLSEVGFEPTPTRVDCELNGAPYTARPSWRHTSLSAWQCTSISSGHQAIGPLQDLVTWPSHHYI